MWSYQTSYLDFSHAQVLDPAGTSDETPEEAGARRIGMRVEDKVLTLEIDDSVDHLSP